MSGRKQHIVPQFLQKGFANNGQIYVYSKNKTPSYIASIKDNFAERDFYSNPQEPLIDDHITKQENQFAPCIDNLRNINENNYFVLKNNNILLDTIINFSLRNKEIQEHIIEDTINELFLIIETINSSDVRKELKKRMHNNQKSNQVLNMMKGNLFGEAIGYSIFILTITYIMLNKKIKILNFSEKILIFLSFVFIGSLCLEIFQKFYQTLSEKKWGRILII
jgi:hypothetical protein